MELMYSMHETKIRTRGCCVRDAVRWGDIMEVILVI